MADEEKTEIIVKESKHTLLQYILYKIDRTTAVVGLIFIAALCTWAGYKLGLVGKDFPESVSKVLTLFFNSMGLYLGFRLGSKK